MISRACLLAALAACGAPREAPVGPGPVPTKIDDVPTPKPSNLVDSGAFVTFFAEKPLRREEFTITRAGSHLVLAAKTLPFQADDGSSSEGELEVDESYRPIRAAYSEPAEGVTYKLGGAPLTLDITRGGDSQQLVASRSVDLFMSGPGIIAQTALCRVNGEVMWSSLEAGSPPTLETQEAYVAQPVGAGKRVVVDRRDADLELLCDGDKLVAGGIAAYQVWFVREGDEVRLDALKQAARPPKHDWKHPQDPTEPWSAYQTWLIDSGVLVMRDGRRRMMRLTAFDAKTGAELTHRDFKVPFGTQMSCEPLPKGRLICEIGKLDYLRLIDARTLEDAKDLAPQLHATLKGSEGAPLAFDTVNGEQVDVVVNRDKNVRLDLAKGTAAIVEMPKQRNYTGTLDATLCSSTGKDGPFPGSRLLACKSKRAATYALSYDDDKSALALVGANKQITWKLALGAQASDVHVFGELLLVMTEDNARRVIAVDAKTGAIKWIAAGPQPTKQ